MTEDPANGNRWSAVTIDCRDPQRLARFWGAIFGREQGAALPGWTRLGTHADQLPMINFQPVAELKRDKVRLHLDVVVPDIEAGISQVTELGGRLTGERHDYEEGVVLVAADPEDNEFCIVQYY